MKHTIKLTDEQLNDLFNALDALIEEYPHDKTALALCELKEAIEKQMNL